jgi:branched-chain amino acid transport system substrate-binding protein
MPSTRFRTFYGGETGWGRKDIYGSVQQAMLPVYITQVVNGKLVEKARVIPKD